MSIWQALSRENPMFIEVRRYRRRLFGAGRTTGLNIAFLTLGAICYVGLLMVVGNGNGMIAPQWMVVTQTILFTLAAPIALNNAVAGEREKGTWDLLLVAPVTKAQIMVGKFAGAFTNVLYGTVLFLLPIFICAVSYQQTDYGALLLAELDSLSFALFACAISLFFSARCRRPFTALGMSLGAMVLGLVIYPMLLTMLGVEGDSNFSFFFALHPIVVESLLAEPPRGDSAMVSPFLLAGVQIFTFIFLTFVTLVWTERTLTFSDTEVKFLPKSHARS